MQPPSGSLLPKCHVGCRCCARSRLGAPAGVLAPGCRPSGPLGLRTRVRKPVRGSGGARAALDRRRGGASRPRAALAEDGGTGGEPGAAAEAGRRQRAPLPPGEPAEMLAESVVEEFEVEEEPWYDNRDLQQGESAGGRRAARPRRLPAANPLKSCLCSRPTDARCGRSAASTWRGDPPHLRVPPRRRARRGPGLLRRYRQHHACGGLALRPHGLQGVLPALLRVAGGSCCRWPGEQSAPAGPVPSPGPSCDPHNSSARGSFC